MTVNCAVGLPNVGEYGDPRLLVTLAEDAEAAGWAGVFEPDVVDRETWLVPGLCRRSSRANPTRTAGTGAPDEIGSRDLRAAQSGAGSAQAFVLIDVDHPTQGANPGSTRA